MQALRIFERAWDCVQYARLANRDEQTARQMFSDCTTIEPIKANAIIGGLWSILPKWKDEEQGGLQKKRPSRKGKKVG